jgi:hypothetical protein
MQIQKKGQKKNALSIQNTKKKTQNVGLLRDPRLDLSRDPRQGLSRDPQRWVSQETHGRVSQRDPGCGSLERPRMWVS